MRETKTQAGFDYPGRHLNEWRLVVRQFGDKWWEYEVLAPGEQWRGGSYSSTSGHKSRKAAIKAGRKALKQAIAKATFHEARHPWELVR